MRPAYALAFTIALLCSPTSHHAQESREPASIEGLVVDDATGLPLAGALVSLDGLPTRAEVETTTDRAGKFRVEDIVAGPHRLIASLNGYVQKAIGAAGPDRRPVPLLTLGPGERLTDVVFRLVPTGVIAGRLSDVQGNPVMGAEVIAVRYIYQDNGSRILRSTALRGVVSDDRGEYRIFGVEPGEYYVRAAYEPGRRPGDPTSVRTLLPTYYAGTTDLRQAAMVRVAAGLEVNAIDFRVEPVPEYRISGRVVNPFATGPDARVSSIYIIPRGGDIFERQPLFRNYAIDPEEIEVRNIPPGTYDLYPAYRPRGTSTGAARTYYTGRTPVQVVDRDIEDLTIVIEPGIMIRGRFLVSDLESTDAQVNFSRLRLNLKPTNGMTGLVAPNARRWTVDADGSFELAAVPNGSYQVLATRLPRGFYVASARFGAEDVLGSDLVVAGTPPGELVLTLSGADARLNGTVIDTEGEAMGEVRVVLLPEFPTRPNPALYRGIFSEEDGVFAMSGIRPGAYRLFAFEQIPQDAWTNAEFMRPFMDRGIPIRFEKNDRLEETVVVIPAGYFR